MKKKRYFPFGYRMAGGQVEACPEEMGLVLEIYRQYLAGASLQQLARMAQASGIPFRENAEGWNKNMVARILDDCRYWDGKQYPAIVPQGLAASVARLRKEKTPKGSPLQFIYGKTVCGRCGAALIRDGRGAPGTLWICKGCGQQVGPIHDAELLQRVEAKFLGLCQNPGLAIPAQAGGVRPSPEADRAARGLRQLLGQRQVDLEEALRLVQDCAAAQYGACSMGDSDYRTARLLQALEKGRQAGGFDPRLFEGMVKRVILIQAGDVQFLLYNQKTI